VAPAPQAPPTSSCDATQSPCHAVGDGRTDDTVALQHCIDTGCKPGVDGRFTVLLPAGKRFLTGSLNLTSGLRLVVNGALLGSTDPSRYPVIPPLPGYGPGQRDSAVHGWGRHQALLSGWNMSHVTVTGSGVIDGQGLVNDSKLGSSWMSRFTGTRHCTKPKCDPTKLPAAKALEFGRPRIWEPMFSFHLELSHVRIINQAFWAVHPYGCDDVYIGHVNVSAPRDEGIANDDGIDPDSTGNVLVEDCWVSVGDNSVAIKSGMDWYGRKLNMASYNQVYRNSVFTCETFAIGSEMSGSVYNITIDNCIFGTDGSDFAGVHFKAPRGRGGSIHNIDVINSVFHLETSKKQRMPISASMFYGSPPAYCHPACNASATPHVHNVLFKNLTFFLPKADTQRTMAQGKAASFSFTGVPEAPMANFHFEDLTVSSIGGASHGWQCSNVRGFTFERVLPTPTNASGCMADK
jgi:polygalacturonase